MKNNMLLKNNLYGVQIIKRVFKGYLFKKFPLDSPLDIIETREIRFDITEEEAIEIGKEILNKVYKIPKIHIKGAVTS